MSDRTRDQDRPDLREQLARMDRNQADMLKHIAKANAVAPSRWALVVVAIIAAFLILYWPEVQAWTDAGIAEHAAHQSAGHY